MRDRFAGMPQVSSAFLPLGKPAEQLAGQSTIGKALAYGPSAASLAKAAVFIRRNRIQIIHATDRPRDASYASLLGRVTGAACCRAHAFASRRLPHGPDTLGNAKRHRNLRHFRLHPKWTRADGFRSGQDPYDL